MYSIHPGTSPAPILSDYSVFDLLCRIKSSKSLTLDKITCKMTVCQQWHRKEDFRESYGGTVFNSRGGGTQAQCLSRHCQKVTTGWRYARIQNWHTVAYQSPALSAVPRRQEQREKTKTRRLITPPKQLVLSVAPSRSNVYQALNRDVVACYLLLILPYVGQHRQYGSVHESENAMQPRILIRNGRFKLSPQKCACGCTRQATDARWQINGLFYSERCWARVRLLDAHYTMWVPAKVKQLEMWESEVEG